MTRMRTRFFILTVVWTMNCAAQQIPFLEGWYVQAGLDMTLQNPYGYDFSDVFPNGKTFGIDVAVGKQFAPEIGVRGKVNWENKVPLLKNDHANWLAPFYQPGVNRDKGGYLGVYGDLIINLKNLFRTFRTQSASDGQSMDNVWDVSLYPRMGVVYNFGISKGAPLLGGGLLTTYRLNDRWRLYADVAYNMCASGFVGSEYVEGTGTGSNSNGYLDMNLGVQIDLGRTQQGQPSRVPANSFWDNWFVQAGLDMSLMNPYGCNFSNVFPKGKTFGVDVALGKWFTHDFGVRGRVNWENGLVANDHVEWVPPVDDPQKNHDKGGFAVFSLDLLLNVTNVIAGYEPDKKWHTSPFVRAGLIRQFAIGSGSPLLGLGLEQTYRLNDRLSLYGDLGYQVTTSESSAGSTGMQVGTGSNGFFNLEAGVVYDLSRKK